MGRTNVRERGTRGYLKNFICVGLEGVKLHVEIAEIPESDGLVGRAGGQDEFRVRVKRQAVHLGAVGLHTVAWLGSGTNVPANYFFFVKLFSSFPPPS